MTRVCYRGKKVWGLMEESSGVEVFMCPSPFTLDDSLIRPILGHRLAALLIFLEW